MAPGDDAVLFRSDVAGTRREPAMEPKPIRIGAFTANAELNVRVQAVSNLFNSRFDKTSDVVSVLEPRARVRSDWGRHALSLTARTRVSRHASNASENNETYDTALAGRLDVDERSSLSWKLAYAGQVEIRGAGGQNITTGGPAGFNRVESVVTGQTEIGRAGLAFVANAFRLTYTPVVLRSGSVIDQSFRDTRTVSLMPRVSVDVTQSLAVVASAVATRTESINAAVGLRRDATGKSLLAGIRADLNGLVVSDVSIGWRRQDYDNPVFLSYGGFTYNGIVDWYPTPLLSFRLQGEQECLNSGRLDVAGILANTASVRAYYDPLRRLRIGLGIDLEHGRYREIGVSTNMLSALLQGEYRINPHMAGLLYVQLRRRTSSDATVIPGFETWIVGFTLAGKL